MNVTAAEVRQRGEWTTTRPHHRRQEAHMIRRYSILAISGALLAVTAAPAAAHVHSLTVTVPGTGATHCTPLGVEPAHVHDSIHPIHHRLHKGPGAPSDASTVVPTGDPVQVAGVGC
jgi:hypothetical protein